MEPWKVTVIDSLRDLSDRSAQERSWLLHRDGAVPSPVELISSLFDDSGLGDLLKDGAVFSADTDRLLRQLSTMADEVDLSQSPEKLLNDPRWQQLRDRAAQAHAAVTQETA
jgi:hypothetical protein